MSAEIINLDDHRLALANARPKSARFLATTDGKVALEIVLEDGEHVDVLMSVEHAAALIIQGTDAVEIAEGIARG